MARLPRFHDTRPAQGPGSLGGAAALACAGRFLDKEGLDEVRDPESLRLALAAVDGVDPSGDIGVSELVLLATHWGMEAVPRTDRPTNLSRDIQRATRSGHPVLMCWEPRRMGLASPGDHPEHWSLVVEWPDDDRQPLILTDGSLAGGSSHGLRQRWSLEELIRRGGLGWRSQWIFLR